MSHPKSRGFTLVELMMVIMIIGLLLALLLPAVGAARESARRAQCLHQIRQLALAVQQFEINKKHYPGWRYTFTIKDQAQTQEVTWPLLVLPYSERRDVYERFQENGPAPENVVSMREIWVCPSDFEKREGPAAGTSYVGNTGREDDIELAEQNHQPPDARANGVFLEISRFGTGQRYWM
jgi:prepilin-type N-terminal cleavage/methylation domain-containing protein